MIEDSTKKAVQQRLKELSGPITLLSFTTKDCELCAQINELLDELSELNTKISIKKLKVEDSPAEVKKYSVEHPPTIVFEGKNKRHLHFHGIPAGHEFATFLQVILDTAKGEPNVSQEMKKKIKAIDFPVHFRVFVTPTCPFCPPAAKIAYDFALLNDKIKADVYEATEFPDLADKYNVAGVPRTIINEVIELPGSYPPDVILMKLMALK